MRYKRWNQAKIQRRKRQKFIVMMVIAAFFIVALLLLFTPVSLLLLAMLIAKLVKSISPLLKVTFISLVTFCRRSGGSCVPDKP